MEWLNTLPAPQLEEGAWRSWTDWGVEQETAEFLYALIRLTKPETIVESGTGEGYASVAIASALADNGHGSLTTFEPAPAYRVIAEQRLAGLPATVLEGFSCDHDWQQTPDMVFLDSFGAHRPREIKYWRSKPVLLVVHDAQEHVKHLDGGAFMVTPRGLWIGGG